jgi:small conductance mechanosensitive channel
MSSFTTEVANRLATLVGDLTERLAVAAVVLIVGYLIVRIGTYFVRKLVKVVSMPAGLRGIVVSLTRAVLWIILTIVILSVLGFSDVIIFFSSSVAAFGLVMAAGGSTLISDVLAGIFLAENKHFMVGDQVKAGENGTEGIIESMDIRRIELRAKDGKLHILPNSIVERKEWVVLATRDELAKKDKPSS